jgi:hypothetical protein
MAADRSHVADNAAQRARLHALVKRLSDQDLRRPLEAGWTVAGVLAHLAFWDQRVLVLLDQWQAGRAPRALDHDDADWINDAGKPLCLALPPRAAADLCRAVADAVDQAVEALPDERLAANAAAGGPVNLLRATHRREHLDAIERHLGG